MTRRPWMIPFATLLLAALVGLPACKKKAPEGDGPAPEFAPPPGPAPGTPPAAGSSDYVLYAHLNAKSIREGSAFKELKEAFTKAGGTKLWDEVEADAVRELGFKPTDLDAVTVCVTEVPPKAEPKFVLILASSKAFDKSAAFGLGGKAAPDSRGFYKLGREGLLHYPDDKTAVILHPDLASQYLGGYAKDRSAWPITAELTKAATGHTAFARLNVQKLPLKELRKEAVDELGPLLKAQAVTLAADLKGKQLSVAGRASFPDAATAGQAKGAVQKFVGMAADEVQAFAGGKGRSPNDLISLNAFQPVLKEAHRAVKEAKVEVSGSDVTLTGSYKADFDIAKLVADLVKQVREAAPRLIAQNNLKQIALGLHNYAGNYRDLLPIYGVGADGAPLKKPTDKPLLSWRVGLLPYIEQDNLYKQFKLNEPWDSEHNKKLIDKMPRIYSPTGKPGKPGYTHYQMAVGPAAMQPGRFTLDTIPDGSSNTIAVVEAAEPVIWTKPDDIMLPGKEFPKDFRKKFGGEFPGGFHAALWDGSVRFVPDSVSDRTLFWAITPNGGEVLGADWGGPPPLKKK